MGKIIDVFLNEREAVKRVVALPFFVLAIGIIAYGASIYILSISDVPRFPIGDEASVKYIIFTTIGGLFCAFFGVYLQSLLDRWEGEREPFPLQREGA